MLNHYGQLNDHIISKVEDQTSYIDELTYLKQEFEQKLLESNSNIQTMEDANHTHEQRIAHLEADCADFEK